LAYGSGKTQVFFMMINLHTPQFPANVLSDIPLIFLLKTMFDLSKLTLCPDTLSCWLIISSTFEHSYRLALTDRIPSSTKNRCDILGADLQIVMP